MGFRTVAIGVGGGPEAAAEYADARFPIDTSDREDVLALAKRENAAGIVTCGTSTAVCTAADVTERLGLSRFVPPYRTAVEAVFKDRWRRTAGDLAPRGLSCTDAADGFARSRELTPPLVLKPADGGGGKGVRIVRQPGERVFTAAFDNARRRSRCGVVVVEEYITGAVVGVESLVLDGKPHVFAIVDKLMTPPPRCITLGVVFPSHLPQDVRRRILRVNEELLARLDIRWGPTHIDMVVDAKGCPKVVDVGPRLAGGPIMSRLVPKAYGYDVYRAVIMLATGSVPEPPGSPDGRFYGSRFMLPPQPGRLINIGFSADDIRRYRIEDVRQLIPDGTALTGIEDDGARVMMFTSRADTYRRVAENLDRFSRAVEIEMD